MIAPVVIASNFVCSGRPDWAVANNNIEAIDISTGIKYQQKKIPFGNSWIKISTNNAFIPSGGGGGVSSVGITMPVAFSVVGSPVISSGIIAITGAGTTLQYMAGDGSLQTFPAIPPSITPAELSVTDDLNIKLNLAGLAATALLQDVNIDVSWSGTLADARIASASAWNAKLTSALANTNILVGNASNVATPVAMSGDATIDNAGAVTIGAKKVTYAKIQDITATSKLLGRVSLGAGVIEEVTLDPDGTLAGNSDSAVATQKAVKTYVDSRTSLYDTSITETSGTATTAEEVIKVFTIAGGACIDTDTIIIRLMVSFISSSGSNKVFKLYADTSPTGVTGTAFLQLQNNNSSGKEIALKAWQDIKCKANGGNTLEGAYVTSGAFTLGVMNTLVTANIDLSTTWYIKITSKKAVSGDTTTFKYGDIEIKNK